MCHELTCHCDSEHGFPPAGSGHSWHDGAAAASYRHGGTVPAVLINGTSLEAWRGADGRGKAAAASEPCGVILIIPSPKPQAATGPGNGPPG